MTTTVHPTDKTRPPVPAGPADPLRRTAYVAGGLYLLTFLTSIPARVLKGPVLDDPNYIVGPGPDTGVLWGGFLDVLLALACIGTAIALYPVVKRHNGALALGFVASRILEAAIIVAGVVSLLSIVTLRQDVAGTAGTDDGTLVALGRSLVAAHGWASLFGPGLLAAVNALLLGSLIYRSRLVPRAIPMLGLLGAPLLLASVTATVFDVFDQFSAPALVAVLPVALWELSLGFWLVVKGFKPVL
jgi:hypothetical protein